MWMWSSDPSMIPTVSICDSTSPLKVLTWQSWQQMSLRGGPSSGSCPKRYGRWSSGNSSCHALTTFQKHTPICHRSQLTFPCWPRLLTRETFDMVMKAVARPMIQVNIPERYLSLVQDPPLKTTTEECLS